MLFFQYRPDGFQYYVFHDEISVRIGMAAILAERFLESKVFVGECSVIVDIHDVVCIGVGFQFVVDPNDGFTGANNLFAPKKHIARWNGADDGPSAR